MKNLKLAGALIGKAKASARSAKVLLDAGDTDSACDRAYYAMYNSARATLIVCDDEFDAAKFKTHDGVISRFGQRIVQLGLVPKELGRHLGQAESVRLLADYSGDSPRAEVAEEMVAMAERFLEEMRVLVEPALQPPRESA